MNLQPIDDQLMNGGRKLRVSRYFVPGDIRLIDGTLVWQPMNPIELRVAKPTVATFDEFLDLADAPDAQVLRYVRRWGVLWLCKDHLEPITDIHHRNCWALQGIIEDKVWLARAMTSLNVDIDYFNWQGEPVTEYRRRSRIAGAIIRISQQLDDAKVGKEADWQILKNNRWEFERAPNPPDAIAVEKRRIAESVNRWLEIGDVRPRLTWERTGSSPALNLGLGTGLSGALAVGLLEQVGRYVIAACSGCRKFYNPESRPRANQDRYCQACREAGVPVANAKHRKSLGLSKTRKAKEK